MTREPDLDSLEDLPLGDPVSPCPEVSAKIRQHCTENLEKRRGLGLGQRLGASVALSGVLVGAFLVAMPSHAPGGLSAVIYGVLGWGLVQGVMLFIGLGRLPTRRGSPNSRAGAVALTSLAFIGILAVGAHHWSSMSEFSTTGVGAALQCAMTALVVGGAATAGILLLWRRTDPFTPSLSGSFVGLAGGLVGAVAVGAVCPADEGLHLTLSHGAIVIALCLIGFALGRRWMAP